VAVAVVGDGFECEAEFLRFVYGVGGVVFGDWVGGAECFGFVDGAYAS
jgi:hypothetical protein